MSPNRHNRCGTRYGQDGCSPAMIAWRWRATPAPCRYLASASASASLTTMTCKSTAKSSQRGTATSLQQVTCWLSADCIAPAGCTILPHLGCLCLFHGSQTQALGGIDAATAETHVRRQNRRCCPLYRCQGRLPLLVHGILDLVRGCDIVDQGSDDGEAKRAHALGQLLWTKRRGLSLHG